MSEKWTKGPWVAKKAHRTGYTIESEQDIIVDTSDEEGRYGMITEEANAHLIAAAPEMYALLEKVKDELLYNLSFDETSVLGAEAEGFGQEIFSLLQKARGDA